MGECIDPTLYARVVVEGIAVKVTEFRNILLQGGVSKGCNDIGFDKGHSLKGYQALEMLNKGHYVLIINFFAYRHYFVFSMLFIEMRVEVAKIRLLPAFGGL